MEIIFKWLFGIAGVKDRSFNLLLGNEMLAYDNGAINSSSFMIVAGVQV